MRGSSMASPLQACLPALLLGMLRGTRAPGMTAVQWGARTAGTGTLYSNMTDAAAGGLLHTQLLVAAGNSTQTGTRTGLSGGVLV